MAMYYYASKISAIACGTRCRPTVLQQSRGQRDRDKFEHDSRDSEGEGVIDDDDDDNDGKKKQHGNVEKTSTTTTTNTTNAQGVLRYRRRHSDQLDAGDIEALGFQKLQVSAMSAAKNSTRTTYTSGSINSYSMATYENMPANDANIVHYDVPKHNNHHAHPHSVAVNYETSVMADDGIMYIDGRIISGPLDSLVDILLPKNFMHLDKELVFSFLLSSRLFLRPHELLGKLVFSVPETESLESLVALLASWTNMFPYDYRDERMMAHVKNIVARCSTTCLEVVVSDILSDLLSRLTDLDQHEQDLRTCQIPTDKVESKPLETATSLQYAQILCRLEKKLAKHVGPEEFLQSSSNVLLDKQKKWDQPSTSCGPPGAQDPKKTCNLETYLDWSARLRLFVCNEILQCSGIRDRSRTVELWSGVAQYCLLVGNYNSATAILETLESPPIARLKITWSKLQVTCQQLDCMQRHADGHGDLWHKQAIVLNENHHHHHNQQKYYYQQQQQNQQQQEEQEKTDIPIVALLSSSSSSTATAATTSTTATTIITDTETDTDTETLVKTPIEQQVVGKIITTNDNITTTTTTLSANSTTVKANATTVTTTMNNKKPNDWVVIPVFADIVKLALSAREDCLRSLPNGHINIMAFDRMAAIVGAFTRHMQSVMSSSEVPAGEYEMFCRHMQKTSKLSESELMMASFDCEEPNNAEKLMYDLN